MSQTTFDHVNVSGVLSVQCPRCDKGEIRLAFPKQETDVLSCPECHAEVRVFSVMASGFYRYN